MAEQKCKKITKLPADRDQIVFLRILSHLCIRTTYTQRFFFEEIFKFYNETGLSFMLESACKWSAVTEWKFYLCTALRVLLNLNTILRLNATAIKLVRIF